MSKDKRRDSWTAGEENYLVKVLLSMTRQGHKVMDAHEVIGKKLGRTASAVSFRWNSELSQQYAQEYKDAKATGIKTRAIREKKIREQLKIAKSQKPKYEHNQPRPTPQPEGDTRYNIPKTAPNVDATKVMAEIFTNPIYFDVLKLMMNMTPEQKVMTDEQKSQVGYGLSKYPESLNEESWSTVETIEHAMSEVVDLLHYLSMLKIKMKILEEENA